MILDDLYTINDLTRNTRYEVRVATRNLAGISDYANSSIYRTMSSADSSVQKLSFIILAHLTCQMLTSIML